MPPLHRQSPGTSFSAEQHPCCCYCTGSAVWPAWEPTWCCSENASTARAGAQLGGAQSPGQLSPVRVDGALVPLDAWGRVPDGHALKDAGVIGWHLDFADPWRSCWGSHINRECCDQRKSTSPMLWFTFHACNNIPEGTPVLNTGRFGLGLCVLWVLSWKQPGTPTNFFSSWEAVPGASRVKEWAG